QHKCRMAALPYQAYISTRLVGLISAAPSDIDWQLSLFSSFCCCRFCVTGSPTQNGLLVITLCTDKVEKR
ncbi:hypothetical protein MJN00_18170, partial [Salmonella enterica subsp. enterica serovar Montevideo]|nr:hypothetical protein [Salmonella enterica subsp. enterica serovar Montevideo]